MWEFIRVIVINIVDSGFWFALHVNRIEELCGPLDKEEYSHRIYQTMLNFVSCGCLPFFFLINCSKQKIFTIQIIYIYFHNILFIYLNVINLIGDNEISLGGLVMEAVISGWVVMVVWSIGSPLPLYRTTNLIIATWSSSILLPLDRTIDPWTSHGSWEMWETSRTYVFSRAFLGTQPNTWK